MRLKLSDKIKGIDCEFDTYPDFVPSLTPNFVPEQYFGLELNFALVSQPLSNRPYCSRHYPNCVSVCVD